MLHCLITLFILEQYRHDKVGSRWSIYPHAGLGCLNIPTNGLLPFSVFLLPRSRQDIDFEIALTSSCRLTQWLAWLTKFQPLSLVHSIPSVPKLSFFLLFVWEVFFVPQMHQTYLQYCWQHLPLVSLYVSQTLIHTQHKTEWRTYLDPKFPNSYASLPTSKEHIIRRQIVFAVPHWLCPSTWAKCWWPFSLKFVVYWWNDP